MTNIMTCDLQQLNISGTTVAL